ncbi:MAG: hypothetical protein ACR2JG_10685, partial [Geodermatophilaceae bacterium]
PIRHAWEAPVYSERTSVGLDVHARSVAAAAIDGVTGELKQGSLTPSHDQIRSWLDGLAGPVAVTYVAGPTGFGLYRSLTEAGVRCVVAAPSKLQRPAGNRVKTDARGRGAPTGSPRRRRHRRLHARWVSLNRRRPAIANVAIAREPAGWCWSLAVLDSDTG